MKYSLSPSLMICFSAGAAARLVQCPAGGAAGHRFHRHLAAEPIGHDGIQLAHIGHGNLSQLSDLLHEVDGADDQAHLRVFVFLAAVIRHAHEPFQIHAGFVGGRNAHIVG